MIRICIVLAALGGCGAVRAERAVLECVADTSLVRGDRTPHGRDSTLVLRDKGAVLLRFRTEAVQGWQIGQAVLLLHVAGGRAPQRVRLALLKAAFTESEAVWGKTAHPAGRWRRVRTFEEGWVAVDLDPHEVMGPGIALSGAAARFAARESVGFAPYLLVEGSAPPPPR